MVFCFSLRSDPSVVAVVDALDNGESNACAYIIKQDIGSQGVIQVLTRIAAIRGLPEQIVVDNGPEFISNAVDVWAYTHGVKLQFIRPGKPVDNCYMKSFKGRFRNECLNDNCFMNSITSEPLSRHGESIITRAGLTVLSVICLPLI